jgi:hypothetical protein
VVWELRTSFKSIVAAEKMIASNFHVHALYTVESMPEARTFLIIVGTLLLKTHSMCEKKKKISNVREESDLLPSRFAFISLQSP